MPQKPNSADSSKVYHRRKFLSLIAASPIFAHGLNEVFADRKNHSLPTQAGPVDWTTIIDSAIIQNPDEAINIFDLEVAMQHSAPPAHFGYMASGVDGEATLRANRADFQMFGLRPKRFVDVSQANTDVVLFGEKYSSPIILAPVGGQKAFHPDGEIATAGAAKIAGHPFVVSTVTSTAIEKVNEAYGRPTWFQLYSSNDWNVCKSIVRRVDAAGCKVLLVTLDKLSLRNQETYRKLRSLDQRDCSLCHDRSSIASHYGPRPMFSGINLSGLEHFRSDQLTWDFVSRLRDATDMKIVLKGILSPDDAELAIEHGVDGIVVSNHGGRVEDSGESTIRALPGIVAAVNSRVPVIVDGGFRRGADVVKGLGLGASAVGIARPYVWGLGAFGQAGVLRALQLMQAELLAMMRQIGAPQLSDISREFVTFR